MKLILDTCLACGSPNIKEYLHTEAMMHTGNTQHKFDRCEDCKLVILNPRVAPDELGEYYKSYYLPYRGDKAWGKYADMVAKDQSKIDDARLATLEKYTTITQHTQVIDIGCGKPTFLNNVFQKHKSQCRGTDFSDNGWKTDIAAYNQLDLHHGLPSELPVKEYADIITMWHYLEHDYHPTETLQDILKHCKSDTKIIIEVPDHDGDSRIKYGKHWSGYHTPRHIGLYTINNMKMLLDRSGWNTIDSYRYGTLDPYTLVWMSKMEQQNIDWSKSMEGRFWGYVAGMAAYLPKRLNRSGRGFMTIVAEPKK